MRWCVERARPAIVAAFFILILTISLVSGCQYPLAIPTTTGSGSGTGSGGTGVTTLTYTNDIQPILASDCVSCHGPARKESGVDLSTYAGVMKTAQPGNANSLLIFVTRPGGLMFGQFSGNGAAKATLIRDWIVSSGAAQ
jgi:cytochrome c